MSLIYLRSKNYRRFRSVVFKKQPKDGAENVLLNKCPQTMLPIYYIHMAPSVPSFTHYCKEPILSAFLTCIRCCISMKLAEPRPKLDMPGRPPMPPNPKGVCPGLGGGVCCCCCWLLGPFEFDPVRITKWTVISSLMLWVASVSWSFMILPEKIKHNRSTGVFSNSADTLSLNWKLKMF